MGVLGGLVGLGGAEFRLPLLIGVFGFAALSAVIVNKAMSLIVVIAAIPARLFAVPVADIAGQWPVVVNLLMSFAVLPRIDAAFLAEPRWGGTTLSAVAGVWAVACLLGLGLLLLAGFRSRLSQLYRRSRI